MIESIYNEYYAAGLRVVSLGMEWGPYNCIAWGESFSLTYPILDDTDNLLYNKLTYNSVPHNLIIDHNMNVIYSTTGFNESAIRDIIVAELDSLPD